MDNETKSKDNLAIKGYTPTKGMHEETTFWSYSRQSASEARFRTQGAEFRRAFVAMQGTARTYRGEEGERTTQLWSTEEHDVFEVRVQKKARGYQPEGCAVLAPKGMKSITKKVMTPSDKVLEGRGIAVRFSRGLFDLTIVSVYCPSGDRDPGNRKRTEKLWAWVRRVREVLPARTMMLVGVDANGHVGSVREWTAREWEIPGDERQADDYYLVGPYGAEEENHNGTLMREFLEMEDMIAVNTTRPGASGKTWYGGNGGVHEGGLCIGGPQPGERGRRDLVFKRDAKEAQDPGGT